MEFLKAYLDEETYEKLEEQLKGKESEVKLANLSTGDYVARGKFNKVEAELKALKKSQAEIEKASLTESEKAQRAIEEVENLKKEFAIKYNRLEAEKILTQAGLTEEDYSEIVSSFVSEDKEKTIKLVTDFSNLIAKQKSEAIQQKEVEILKGTPSPAGNSAGSIKGENIGVKLAQAVTVNQDEIAEQRNKYFK